MRNTKRNIFLVVTVAIMLFIFIMSSQDSTVSSGSSKGVIEIIARIVVKDYDSRPIQYKTAIIDNYQFFIRKTAHFTIYLCLGVSSLGLFSTYKFKNSKTDKFLAFVLCVLYSVSDEIHQLFVPGRAGMISDVILDSTGALLGIVIMFTVSRIIISNKGKKYGKIREK